MLSPLLRRYTWNSAWLYNARIFIALVGTCALPWWLGDVKLTIPLTLDGTTLSRIIAEIQWTQNAAFIRNLGTV